MKAILFSMAAALLAQQAFAADPPSGAADDAKAPQIESELAKIGGLIKAGKQGNKGVPTAEGAPVQLDQNQKSAAKDCAKDKCSAEEAEATCSMDGLKKCEKDKDLSPEEATGIVNKANPAGKCDLAADAAASIRISVLKTKTYGVTATVKPQNAKVGACMENVIRAISWPAKACDCNVYTYSL